MKKRTIFRSKRYGPIRKVALALSLVGAGAVVIFPVVWAYQNTQLVAGTEAAQVIMAQQVFSSLVLTAPGLGVAYLVDWSIRRRRFIFHQPRKGSPAEAIVHIWGYQINCPEEVVSEAIEVVSEPTAELEPLPVVEATQNVVTRPKRRGRKPTFPLEAWLPIAATWENRDPVRDAFTLDDLIKVHLGKNYDDSPIISKQVYYSKWRDLALEELDRRKKAKLDSIKSSQNRLSK